MQRNPSSRRPPVQRTPQRVRPTVKPPRRKQLGARQLKRGVPPR